MGFEQHFVWIKNKAYHKALEHPTHLAVAFLNLLDHVIARDAHLELLMSCFPTALRHNSDYPLQFAASEQNE